MIIKNIDSIYNPCNLNGKIFCSQVISDKQSTQVKARGMWLNLLSSEDQAQYYSRYRQTYGFGFLHSAKNLVCCTRNYNLSDGADFFSIRTILQLWNDNTADIKSILDSKSSMKYYNIVTTVSIY